MIPFAVIAVPKQRDPGELLRSGPCDARPPRALHLRVAMGTHGYPVHGYPVGWREAGTPIGPHDEEGLVLWWNWTGHPEGFDRARRALRRLPLVRRLDAGIGRLAWGRADVEEPGFAPVLMVALWLVRAGLARRSLALASGREELPGTFEELVRREVAW